MNEESQNPSIEPELEARIVALVLGEASDFECEELNRLIESRPELAAFKVQIQSVHGLLQDAGTGEFEAPAEEWKLPADQRNAVLAVIRGEATVPAATRDVNQSARQQKSFKWSLLWKRTAIVVVVCVAGFFAMTAQQSFELRELTSKNHLKQLGLATHDGSAVASMDETHNPEPPADGTILRDEFESTANIAAHVQSGPAVYTDAKKSSEVALLDIQNALGAATLPTPEYLADDVQYVTENPAFTLSEEVAEADALVGKADGGSENLRGEVSVPQMQDLGLLILKGTEGDVDEVIALAEKNRAKSPIEKLQTSTPQGAESPEVIARNDGGSEYKGLRHEDRDGDGQTESQPDALFDSMPRAERPRDNFGRSVAGMASPDRGIDSKGMTIPKAANGQSEPSDSRVESIRLRTDVADRENVLLGAMSALSAAEGGESGGKSDAPSSRMSRELEKLNVSGNSQGVTDKDQSWNVANNTPPKEESTRNIDFDFNLQDSLSQGSASAQQPTQQRLRDRGETEREFFKKRMVSPADGSRIDGERFGNDSQWMDRGDIAGTTAPAGVSTNEDSGDRFDSSLRGPGNAEHGGGVYGGFGGGGSGGFFGGGGGFGLNRPLTENGKEVRADANGIADGKMGGIAGFDDSGLDKWSRFNVPGRGGQSKTRAALESPPIAEGFNSSPSSEMKRPAREQAVVKGLETLSKGKNADQGRVESKRKKAELPPKQDVAVNSEKARGNFDSFSALTPAPMTGTAVGQPPVSLADDFVRDREILPSKRKEKPVELQRQSGGLGLARGLADRRFRYATPKPNDNSESAKRSTVNRRGQGRSQYELPLEDAPFSLPENAREKTTNRVAVERIAPTAGLNEKSATKEAFSTFSLHVSDVSFKLSLAGLLRGEWPEAAKVRIEEFVNAFDYGDPMPGDGEKVACTVEQSIHPFVQQRNLLRVSMRTAAAGRASQTPLRLTFLLDNSGSMERFDRQQTVRRAFSLLAQQLTPIDQVTLISFARQPRLLADKVSGSEAGKLVRLIEQLPREGGTNIEAALQLAFEKAREQQTPSAQNRIILLTDGAVNLGNANPESLSQMVTTMRSAGIAFDAAGISAEGLNDEVLEALTRKGDGRYYLLDSIEAADDGFASQIAGALRPSAKNVKVQVEFNPKRVGRYKLLGFEKHILKKEDFHNDKVDAAEMAAAEAGVAMYQFEARPDGGGDVGSVSVRFRDLSTGQMIENRWPIPYEADAPRPDQAAPSLRLATSAALLAAKLRGEPLGESVDLQVLSHLISGLPEQNRNNKRVQQLQQMIEQARQLSEK